MKVLSTAEEINREVLQLRKEDKSVGFVPTLGALHEGHCALFRRAAKENDVTVASIYVNAQQFDSETDAEAYPRDFERDKKLAAESGVNVIFHPDDAEMYPPGNATQVVSNSSVTRCYEGAIRPNFFAGVITVVSKLLNAVPADRVYFGQKDLQQYIVVSRMVEDLLFQQEIVPVQVIRDENGIAYSSRNQGLDESGWETAQEVYEIMRSIKEEAAELSRQKLFSRYVPRLEEAGFDLQYLDVVRFPHYDPAWPGDRDAVVILAGYAGDVRLKDNLPLHVEDVAKLEQ